MFRRKIDMAPTHARSTQPVFRNAASAFFIAVVLLSGLKSYANRQAARKLDEALARISLFASVTYERVDFALFSHRLTISSLTVYPRDLSVSNEKSKKLGFRIRRIRVEDSLNLGASGLGLSVEGIEVDPAVVDAGTVISELGIKGPLLMGLRIDLGIDVKEKELNLRTLYFDVQGLAALSIGARLGNISITDAMIGKVQDSPREAMSMLMALSGITLSSAQISYTDGSLAQRLMTKAAKEQNVSIERFKSGLVEKLKAVEKESEDEFVRGLVKPLSDFIAQPGKISIKAAPQKPVPLGTVVGLDSTEAVIKTLGIRIE